VLSPLVEGLPRALLEAGARGLPCLAHDSAVARYVLGEHGSYVDVASSGAIAGALPALLAEADDQPARERRSASILERFAWARLAPRYVEMLHRVGSTPARSGVRASLTTTS
jgi:1,2-diacylglycerol 3-alpha-glucosyltransferase